MVNQKNKQKSKQRIPADHIGILLASLAMMAIGWIGLVVLIPNSEPSVVERWSFFLLLHLGITGTLIPVVRYFNVRLSEVAPPGGVIVRQSVWLGLYIVIIAWLQMQRGLTLPVAFFVGLVFVVLEIFIRTRELNDEDYD